MKNKLFYIIWAVPFVGVTPVLNANAMPLVAPQSTINCTNACKKELQAALDKDRLHNHIVGSQMSISLPGPKGELQPTMNFYSGYTMKNKAHAVGALVWKHRMDLFAQGSITKSYIAAIILQLAYEGRLSLSDPLGKYFPEYPDWGNVTIQQLLNMTSGIYNWTDDAAIAKKMFAHPARQWQPINFVRIAYHHHGAPSDTCKTGGNLCFAPGTSYLYSNTDYILAGMIIQKVTHCSLSQVMDKRLLGAQSTLGKLNNTFFMKPYSSRVLARLIHGYGVYGQKGVQPKDLTNLTMNITAADGGNVSNSEDIINWSRLLFQSNAVLSDKQKKDLESLICEDKKSACFGQPVSTLDSSCRNGYGLGISGEYAGKGAGIVWNYTGEDPGYLASFYLWPKYNIDVAIQRDTDTDGDSSHINDLYNHVMTILLKYQQKR